MTTPQVITAQPVEATVEVLTVDSPIVQVNAPGIVVTTEVIIPGPQGIPGLSGADLSTYIHTQVNPAITWTINHNLGIKPSVELLNTGSQEIEGDVIHTSTNQVIVQFTSPIAGTARLI